MGFQVMIESVTIKRFRGIKEGELSGLTPLTILVGPNGSGKSSVLDALLVANDESPPDALLHVADRRLGSTQPERWVFYRADQFAGAEITSHHGGKEHHVVQIVRDSMGGQVRVEVTGVDASGDPISRSPRLLRFGQRTDDLPPNPLVPPGFTAVPGDSPIRLVRPGRPDLEHELPALYTRAIEQGRAEEVRSQIQGVTHADDLKILAPAEAPVLYLAFKDYAIPVVAAGDGIHALLLLSLELAVRSGGAVLLEEPEAHLHPGAIREAARAIWTAVRRGVQVFVSTHSLELIDALLAATVTDTELDNLSVYRLLLEAGVLRKSRIAGPDVAFMRSTIEEDLR